MTNRDPLFDSDVTIDDEMVVDTLETSERDASAKGASSRSRSGAKNKGSQAMDNAKGKADELTSKAEDMVGQDKVQDAKAKAQDASQKVQEKASDMGDKAQDKADAGMDKAASGLSTASDKLRDKGEQQGGQVGKVANQAADTMDSASGYLREHDSDQMLNDLEDLIRRKPVESLLVAAGVGLLLSRIFS